MKIQRKMATWSRGAIPALKNHQNHGWNRVKRYLEPGQVPITNSGTSSGPTWFVPGNYNIIVECYPYVSEFYIDNWCSNYINLFGKRALTGYTWLPYGISKGFSIRGITISYLYMNAPLNFFNELSMSERQLK